MSLHISLLDFEAPRTITKQINLQVCIMVDGIFDDSDA